MEKKTDETQNNTKEENGVIIDETKNTFMPKDEKELKYLEKMADEAMEAIKTGNYKPFKEFKW